MAQSFSKKFYNSDGWQAFREWYIGEVGGVCERCGEPGLILHHRILLTPYNVGDPTVTMNPANVMFVCKDCHERLHHSGFDENGRPVPENYWHDEW